MHFDRKIINLILQIKRTLPEDKKPEFMLSAPDLLEQIKEIYQTTNRVTTKALAEQVLQLVEFDATTKPQNKTRMYRGAPLADSTNIAQDSNEVEKPGMMYRGRPV